VKHHHHNAGHEIDEIGACLGRDPVEVNVVFPGTDTSVSRRHCEIRIVFQPRYPHRYRWFFFNTYSEIPWFGRGRADVHFEVRDLGSRNGTFVVRGDDAPHRVSQGVSERVDPGDKVLVGSPQNILILELTLPAPG
jgi:pSer/pThr/pTyr-binding forkhead associated (FHA) protein